MTRCTSLFLVNGHGGSDPGAVRDGVGNERDFNIDAVLGCNDYIARNYETGTIAIEVATYPADAPFDGQSGLLDKIARANAKGRTNLTVELHHNIAAGGTGAQVWCSQFAARTDGDESSQIAPLFAAELATVVGDVVPILTSDHSRFGRLGILDDVVGTSILVELRRLELATDPASRYASGAAIARALAGYFGWTPRTDVPVYRAPTCTRDAFLSHLNAHPSPAVAEVAAIWDVLTAAGVDPAVALGFFHHESACGTLGRAVTTKSWGNIRYRPGLFDAWAAANAIAIADVDGFVGYATWSAGARHFVDHLLGRDGTNAYAGMTTVEQIVPVWAPASDGNAPTAYIAAVEQIARDLAAAAAAPPSDAARLARAKELAAQIAAL